MSNFKFLKIKPFLFVMSLYTLSACAVVPKFSNKTEDCDLYSRQVSLDIFTMDIGRCEGDCVAILLGVGTLTAVVSGSIYLVGNTVHWLEKEGRCDDSLTRNVLVKFSDYYASLGGEKIEPKESLSNYDKRP